jgi:pSer/pThr/pTyr-binding forkhead associated (FHA) protein
MDEPPNRDATGLPFQGPHRSLPQPEQPPASFLPLRLVLQPGPTVVELTRPDMIVGRHSEADIRLPLPDVSRRHCRFVFGNGSWVVMDLNSLNGVFVNDEPVSHATLKQGDRVRIGGYVFAVDLSREHHTLAEPDRHEDAANNTLQLHQTPPTFLPRRKAS